MVIKKNIKVEEIRESTRIEKDHNNSFLAGVCAGISNYFGINLTLLRILFLFSVFGFGFGIVMYFILVACLPSDDTNWLGYNKTIYY